MVSHLDSSNPPQHFTRHFARSANPLPAESLQAVSLCRLCAVLLTGNGHPTRPPPLLSVEVHGAPQQRAGVRGNAVLRRGRRARLLLVGARQGARGEGERGTALKTEGTRVRSPTTVRFLCAREETSGRRFVGARCECTLKSIVYVSELKTQLANIFPRPRL